MKKLNLTVNPRAEGVAPNTLRRDGEVPGIVYGKEADPLQIAIPTIELKKIFKEAGESTIINMTVDGSKDEPMMVLIKDTQLSPDRGEFLHVDFYRIKLGEKLRVTLPLTFEGEPPAVKNLGGILITNKNEIEIECLPKDLISEIIVDLSKAEELDSAITIKDLEVPEGIEVLDNEEETVAVVTPQQEEEEEPVVSEEEAVASVEASEEKSEDEGSDDSENPPAGESTKDSEEKKE
ncbi:MAG: 50S ribosomal protein L25 [Patescibacteria group bacterium]|nr:50S ribosomal protein L25 [Patescibacteria group bacterium]